MKTVSGFVFLFLLFSAAWLAAADDAANSGTVDTVYHLLHHGRLPSLDKMDPKVKKCIADFKTAGSISCVHEITASFWTHKKSISSDCCAKIKSTDEDCSTTLFGHFRHPFFQYLLKEDCSGSGGSPSAPPPSS